MKVIENLFKTFVLISTKTMLKNFLAPHRNLTPRENKNYSSLFPPFSAWHGGCPTICYPSSHVFKTFLFSLQFFPSYPHPLSLPCTPTPLTK